MKLKAIYEMWSWICAVRINPDTQTSIINDKTTPFITIPNSKRYWCADPFIFKKDGKVYLFFEAFDILKRKGLLGFRELKRNEFGKINIIYEGKEHLSFPFIYESKGELFIIPESAKSNEMFRLKCTDFPYKWEKEDVLVEDTLVDTIRFEKDDIEFYISEKVIESGRYDRVDIFYRDEENTIKSLNNPVKTDSTCSRGAGAIFEIGGILYRPAQDCSESYGESLCINRVDILSKSEFSESVIDRIHYSDIVLDKKIIIDGIHTYNKLENIEVIDLRIPGKFSFLYTIGFFNKVFKKVFNGEK